MSQEGLVVQYRLLGATNTFAGEIIKNKNAITQAMQQHYCPHHRTKIEVE